MVFSAETVMTAMSNPPLNFLFVVYRLEVEETRAYSINTTWLTINVCLIKFYIKAPSLSHVLFIMSTSCLYTCCKTYLQWLHPLQADQFISEGNSSFTCSLHQLLSCVWFSILVHPGFHAVPHEEI
jgi:hypothetical protein